MDFVHVDDKVLRAAEAAALLGKTKTTVRVRIADMDKSIRVVKSELLIILKSLDDSSVTLSWFDGPEGGYVIVQF